MAGTCRHAGAELPVSDGDGDVVVVHTLPVQGPSQRDDPITTHPELAAIVGELVLHLRTGTRDGGVSE